MPADPDPLIARDRTSVWHPCMQQTDLHAVPPLHVVGAHGCRLRLADGREILDGIASWWCKSLGHGHPRLRAALTQQAEAFEHVILATTTNEPVVRLSERLCRLVDGATLAQMDTVARGRASHVLYGGDGSTGIEIALKLALQGQRQRGQPRRTRFAALRDGYHGESMGALSVGDCGLYKDTFAPLLFPCTMLGPLPHRSGPEDPRWDDASAEWPAIERALAPLAAELAAIIVEPVVQGAAGMRVHSPDLLRRLRVWCDANGVWLIADEIFSGMGRCGAMTACSLAGVAPDIAVLSKGLTGGVLPLCAVVTTAEVHDAFLGTWESRTAFLHSTTFGGNALAVAVANAALDSYRDEDVLGMVARHGPRLRARLAEAVATRPWLGPVRGVGLLAAVDLRARDGSALDPLARTGWRVYQTAIERGALLRPLGDTMYLCPPLNAPWTELEAMVVALIGSVDAVCGR